jgi:hypothetical protein
MNRAMRVNRKGNLTKREARAHVRGWARKGEGISPQTERKDVSRGTFSPSILLERPQICEPTPKMPHLSDLPLNRPPCEGAPDRPDHA